MNPALIIGFLKTHWIAFAIVGTVVGVLSAAYFKGIEHCEAKAAQAVSEAERKANEYGNELTLKYVKKISELQRTNERLSKEIEDYVPDIPDCDYGPRAIGMLDDKRGVSPAASVDARADAAPATHLSQQGATERWVRDAEQYQICRERLNALIEWHEK